MRIVRGTINEESVRVVDGPRGAFQYIPVWLGSGGNGSQPAVLVVCENLEEVARALAALSPEEKEAA